MKRKLLLVMLFFCCNGLMVAQEKSTKSIDELITRLENIGSVPGAISEYYTSEELTLLQHHFNKDRIDVEEKSTSAMKSMIASEAYTSSNSEFGSFEPPNGEVTVINNNTSIINAGVINPNDSTEALVLDNVGDFYSIDLATGVFTSLGSIPGAWLGAEVHPVTGIVYALSDDMNLYSIDTVNITATLIGPTGLGGIPIALAIDGGGNAYTYDVLDDHLYSIDLNTGLATDIGHIGFDSNFAQGMFWHEETDTIYMAAFNNTLFEAQLRSVNTVTGETNYLGLLGEFASLSQYGWASSETIASPVPDENLLQTWYLYRMDIELGDPEFVEDIDPPISPFLTINDELEFNGFGACNTFSGIFVYDNENLRLTPINFISTEIDCGFQQHSDFEEWYFYQFSGDYPINILDVELTQFSFDVHPGFTFYFSNEPLSINDYNSNSFTIYPNPASDQLYVSFENNNIETITIYSALGRKIVIIENVENAIDVSELSKGIYFIEASTSKGRSIQKLIKK